MGKRIVDAQQAFLHLVRRGLTPDAARRYAAISETKKGQRKILDSLNHEFETYFQGKVVMEQGNASVWDSPCYVFHRRLGFGVEAASLREAYDQLSTEGGWLLVLCDGSAGIHCPEDRWDLTRWILTS